MENTRERMKRLTEEVLRGEIKRDTQPNSSNSFSGQVQADYYANARRNMQSEMFFVITHANQQVPEILCLKSGESAHDLGR